MRVGYYQNNPEFGKVAENLDRIAAALLDKETLDKEELRELTGDVEPESRAAETVGIVRALNLDS